jgi:hypothetical protein
MSKPMTWSLNEDIGSSMTDKSLKQISPSNHQILKSFQTDTSAPTTLVVPNSLSQEGHNQKMSNHNLIQIKSKRKSELQQS